MMASVVGGRSWVMRTPGWLALRGPVFADRGGIVL